MRKQLHTLIYLFCLILVTQGAFAVIAYPYPVEITQPDGSKLTVILKGDEHVKWAQTVDGYSIMRNSNGYFEYAILDSKSEMVLSGVKVKNQSERGPSEIQLLGKISKGIFYSKSQVGMLKSISKMYEENSQKAFPTTGSRKLICILIGFTGQPITKSKADFNNLFNQVGYTADGATGSVNDFYKENSWGLLDLSITVAGPYVAAHPMAYYGANTGGQGSDAKARDLVTEAVTLANPDVNYADFDNDADGSIDGVYVIYAGYGEEAGASTDAIWAHAWSIPTLTFDATAISRYSCSAELRENSGTGITRIGVICHEFGHVLGAADYYDTDYETNGSYAGTGYWDLMASGSWNNNGATPAHHNAYTKIYDYAWASATTLSAGIATPITLDNAELNSTSFYRVNTSTPNEFYLIENRQKQLFDNYIPGHGMVIYHVDENYMSTAGNKINAGIHQGMYPVCASATGNPTASYGTINDGGLPFPGTSNKTSFTDATTPNARSWAGVITNTPLTSISENTSNKTVSFSYIINTIAPTATTFAASEVLTTGATLNAQVRANLSSTTVTFEYGTTTSYGSSVDGTPNIITGSEPSNITATLTGLTPNTTYNYRVKAVNSIGTTYGSNMTFTPLLLNLPVTENFTTSTLPSGWLTQNVGLGSNEAWVMSNTANAGGTAYELKCLSLEIHSMTTRVITPAINTVGVSKILLSFKHFFNDYGPGATLRIQSSTDKVTWTNETWSLASSADVNVGPATVYTTISNNLNSGTTFIAFVVNGDLWQIDNWFIDNVLLAITVPVTTNAVSAITAVTATCGGNVPFDGGTTVTAKGICWSTTANPTVDLTTKTSDGTGMGAFTSSITGLTANTTYHVRAYATNGSGTAYGNDITFNTIGTSVDNNNSQDGNYLNQNYPNPFDESTKIDFKLEKPGKVNLTVYNTLGQVVDVIVDEYLLSGNHSITWTPKEIAGGIYFYQLKADGIKETKRLIKK